MTGARIGVDLGGTKIEAAVVEADGTLGETRRIETPRGDYEGTVTAVAELVTGLEKQPDSRLPVGVGMPGAVSPASGLVKNANSVWLIGKPFHEDLAIALGRPVRVANDADCFALSEAADGAGAGATAVFGVILGTGVGGGFVHRGRLVSGPNAIGGEWGHNPLPWPRPDELPGPACYCGKHGCIETFLSGPALAAAYAAASGKAAGAKEISQAADAGDPLAMKVMDDYVDRLARGLASVINVIDPDVIVLGGGLSAIGRLYRDVAVRLPDHVFSDSVETKILSPAHGPSGGVRGAAWLWPPDPGP